MTTPAMLHPELLAPEDGDTMIRDGARLDHAEGASKPLRSRPEPQPRGAKVYGNRPIDQAEAAARFIAAPEQEKMHAGGCGICGRSVLPIARPADDDPLTEANSTTGRAAP